MEFKAITDPRARAATACAVIGMHEDGALGPAGQLVDQRIGGAAARLFASKDFAAKLGDTLLLSRTGHEGPARVLLVGLGARKKFDRRQYRKAAQAAAQALLKTGATDAVVYLAVDAGTDLALDAYRRARGIAETFRAQGYRIPDLKTGPKPKAPRLREVRIATGGAGDARHAQRGLDDGVAVADGVAFARDLANLPPNVCTPTHLGVRAQSMRELRGVKVTVLGERQIKALKMGAFLAVAQGSTEPPRLIVCEYRGAPRAQAPLCLVGKGITFDSGGISLKDPPAMDEMKFDMCGAATVLGAFRTAAHLRLPINLVAIVPTCENMPAGNAVKPADVVTTMSGQTVEVLNTDAEGRLILADGLSLAVEEKPDMIIDIATLTGACVVALGYVNAGVFANDEDAYAHFQRALAVSDERFWRLPLDDEYRDLIVSQIADIKNTGGRWGGAVTAAMFLKEFVGETPWLHLDIAGTAWIEEQKPWIAAGPSGIALRSILEWVRAYDADVKEKHSVTAL